MSANLKDHASWEASPLAFLSRQFIQGVPRIPSNVDLSGQTAIITGSNVGLGFESARQLLALNLSHLVIAVRSQARGDAAAQKLRDEFPRAKIEVSIVDMLSYRSVQAFAERCEALERLDIAILNAGLSRPQFERSEETRHEVTLQTNYLSTALLALLLIPILREKRGSSSPAHLALVGSDMAYWAKWDASKGASILDVADDASKFESTNAYKNSKLFLLMFVSRLSQLVPGDEVVVNFPNPGACRGTAFFADNPSVISRFMFTIVSHIIARPVAVGARQYVDAVVVKGVESHGGFVGEGKVKPYVPMMYEESGRALQDALWDETMKELSFANPTGILEASQNATVSFKIAALALSATTLMGVDTSPCRPTSTTSGSSVATTATETASVVTSTTTDLTLSTGTTSATLTVDTALTSGTTSATTTAPTDTTTAETSTTAATTTAAPQPTCLVQDPAPAGQTCATYKGVAASTNAIIGPGDASSLGACADSCTQTPGCPVLSFGSGLCTLFKLRQGQFGIFNQEPKQTFYDI
ncbi:hypothetical protein ACJ41O_000948 [Fusarium nematophilum]